MVDCGGRALQAACVLPVAPNMVVKTNTPAVRQARRINLELILSNHEKKCLSCVRSQNCELQKLCLDLGVESGDRFAGSQNQYETDTSSVSIVRNNNKCILCRRCVGACANVQKVGVIGPVRRGFKTAIESPWEMKLAEMACINWRPVHHRLPRRRVDRNRQHAGCVEGPGRSRQACGGSARARCARRLGEEFGLPMGTSVTGKMAAALRRLGFAKVFDTDFGAD